LQIEFKKLNENASFPERASEFAGGWDVKVTEIEKVSADFVICKLGFALSLPSNYKLTLVPRSSLTKTHWVLQNSPGLGDEDYRGEYQLRFRCIPINYGYKWDKNEFGNVQHNNINQFLYEEFPFEVGDRVGQVYLEEVVPIEFIEVNELSESKRGDGGFGSTNK